MKYLSRHRSATFTSGIMTGTSINGVAFNPVIATFLTAGLRLIMATTEAKLAELGSQPVYCDTGSCFITPEHTSVIQKFFKPLNPYDEKTDMLKVEDDKVEEDNPEEDPKDTIGDYVCEPQEISKLLL